MESVWPAFGPWPMESNLRYLLLEQIEVISFES